LPAPAYVIADLFPSTHARRSEPCWPSGSEPASPPEERGIAIEIAAKAPCQQQRLHVGQQAGGHALAQKRMDDLLLLAFLPRHQHFLPGGVVHPHRPALGLLKSCCTHLPSV